MSKKPAEHVLITGASSGIGRATAFEFARRGARLFLVARRESRLSDVAERCSSLGATEALTACHDLSVAGEGESVVENALRAWPQLDILILNAGYGHLGEVEEVDPAEMERMWRVNYQAGYESIQAALPHFKERREGHIVLVSSIIGKKGMPFHASYCATKFAQIGLGEALWGELKPWNIAVTMVCPGYTSTEFHSVAAPGTKGYRPVEGQSPEEVARKLVRAVEKKKRIIHLTGIGRLLLVIDRISSNLASWITFRVAHKDRARREAEE